MPPPAAPTPPPAPAPASVSGAQESALSDRLLILAFGGTTVWVLAWVGIQLGGHLR